ncbi:hypothetical protein DKG77_10590 [Flagellimonas aquimarina]|jgi:hypothetical protein|uniref:tRNA_anti-like n=1 Tax=Flagellimonas aquimarina TaxID=2201895 RepID=A0A316L062_9FLAO|nr:hypothetical protein [Allomuricauda koreensis]PWL38688.1 hypothetical protein DKG77_10590 [Allomuricauda koreensis]
MLKKTNTFKIAFFLAALMVIYLLFQVFFKPDYLNIAEAKPELYLSADTLISHFRAGDQKFLKIESIVEIEGSIKEINTINNRFTILLKGKEHDSSSVICDMQANQNKYLSTLKPKDTIRLKGVFKGFLKDAVFLNCVISDRKINE